MQLKKISKFIIGALCGSVATVSIYSFAGQNSFTQAAPNTAIPVEEINNFAKVYSITKNYYVENINDTKLMKGALSGMLSNLDPHSTYLGPEEFKQLSEMTSGSFAGLGIELSKDKDGGIRVVAPIDGTPAYYAGIRSGDLIIKINGELVANMSLDQAIKKMRGQPKTKVILTIARKNELKPLLFTIIRAMIEVRSINYAMLDANYVYVRVTRFQGDTVVNLANTLNKIYHQNPHLKGMILDLRDNPGGILQAAVGVSGAFLPEHSLVVYTNGRAPNTQQKFYVDEKDYAVTENDKKVLDNIPVIFKQIPLVVVVNQGTASAAEIVAGSLQDYNRAKIIGVRTFGKGSVQTVIPLSEDTAIKLTTALYFTPKGRSIQAEGIKPDVIVKSEYNDIYSSWDFSEASLDNHLTNPTNPKENMVKESTPVIIPTRQISTQDELKQKMEERINKRQGVVKQDAAQIDLNNDFQLQWAYKILQGKPLPIK